MNTSSRIALVLGATGGIGGETARALLRSGWTVRALSRRDAPASSKLEWIRGDAMVAADVAKAAAGVDVIVHAVNPPGYKDWERQVLPMIDNTIAAARASGARIVLPGTIYNYGHDAFPLLREDSPQHAVSRKGELRVELERRMQEAAGQGVRSLILRCGDFYGPHSGNNWLAQGVIKPDKPLHTINYPGPPELGHSWAYLPDIAATIVALLEREDQLDDFARFHFGGDFITGNQLLAAIRRAAGDDTIKQRMFPWPLVTLAAPFVETMREVRKMRYLWESTIELDGSQLDAFLGVTPRTPLDEALRTTLVSMNVIPAPSKPR